MKPTEAFELIRGRLEGLKERENLYQSKCPFCHSDKHKFYVDKNTYMYSCKRGSCGQTGNLITLFKHFGINEFIDYNLDAPALKKPEPKITVSLRELEEVPELIDYMDGRGISLETLKKANVKAHSFRNSFAFEAFTDDGKLESVVYRGLDKRMFMEKGSRGLLWNLQNCSGEGMLYVTEGRIDALTLIEMGIENVVSMPNGTANLDWITNHFDSLHNYDKIVLCYDNDTAGIDGLKKAKQRLDFTSLYMLDYNESNDINDMYFNDFTNLRLTVENPKQIELEGFVSLQNINTSDGVKNRLYSVGIGQLNRIFGGVGLHQTTIICSESGAGKSTTVSNMIKGLLSEGSKVGIYSGELNNSMLKAWLYTTIGGEKAIEKKEHPFRKGEFRAFIKKEYEEKIDKLVSDRLFIYDGDDSNAYKMIDGFEKLYKQHGVNYFFLDNLSIANMNKKGLGKYEAEEEFSKRVAEFSKQYPIHLLMVAHPTKTSINTDPNFMNKDGSVKPIEMYTQQMVKGSASIVNLCHNILFLTRAKDHEKAFVIQEVRKVYEMNDKIPQYDRIKDTLAKELSLIAYLVKNRSDGNIYEKALFGYDKATRRIFGVMEKEKDLSKEVLLEEDTGDATEVEMLDLDMEI